MTTGSAESPVVILCGFMGVGKSLVGARLADLLDVEFIDTDERIEKSQRLPIAAIFERDGECRFRILEHDLVSQLSPKNGAVIATGGGMLVDESNRKRLTEMGTLVHLDADLDTITRRIAGDFARPMLSDETNDAGEQIRALWEARYPSYQTAALRIDTSTRSCDEAALDIAEYVASNGRQTNLRLDTRPLPWRTPSPGNTRLCRVLAGTGAAAELGGWLERLDLKTSVFFLVPPHIEELHIDRLTAGLDERAIEWRCIAVNDGDANKTLEQASALLDALAAAGARRDSVVVTVGGGVTGDLGGFVAATYMRGVPWINVPTTLLAQVDAGIGGKVGVNSERAKNIAGTVYQPHLVLSDPALLSTLPARELSAGMAEVIKTAMIGDADLFKFLRSNANAGTSLDDISLLARFVRACTTVKGRIVETDPFERDLRRVLNLGHTLGHALETALGYDGIRHGEGVALGILAVLRVSMRRGLAVAQYFHDTRSILAWAKLPVTVPEVNRATVRDALMLDKKRRSATLTCVVPIEPGRVQILDGITEDELLDAMTD